MISTKIVGANAAKRLVERIKGRMQRLELANKKASIFLDRWVQTNFKTEGGNVGGWLEFAYGGRLTTKSKSDAKVDGRYVNTSAKLEQDTGTLRLSFRPAYDSRTARISSGLPYAKTQNKTRQLLPEPINVNTGLREIYGHHVKASIHGA